MAHGRKIRDLAPIGSDLVPGFLDEMDKVFERFFGSEHAPSHWPVFMWPEERTGVMAMTDVFEDGNQIVVKAELPGMKKEDLTIEVGEDSITISGEKKKEEKIEKKDFYRLERREGSFRRTIALPAGVKPEKAKAGFKDGVLEIRVEKAAPAKKNVKVEIK